MRSCLAALCLVLSCLPTAALAWGPAAHRMVAELAEARLAPAARTEARRLLAGASLADVSNWADEIRADRSARKPWRGTAPLHYVNFGDATCRYVARRDCPDGRCVVAAIERYAQVLGDRSRPDAERAEALRFVVHFVADVHQPLHAGYRPGRGGNRYQVRWQGRGSNLHAVWDSGLLGTRRLGWHRYAERLAREPLPRATGAAAQWAEESCRITRDDGLYPRGHRLPADYVRRLRPLAERRVREAATRLAKLLDGALAR